MGEPSGVALQFLGGVGTVTGSKYLVKVAGRQILVDCGLFQGVKNLRLKNWDQFPVPPEKIDAVILTHAHLDHSGYLPKLVREGFRGPIYATAATAKLCEILLTDSAYLMEEEASYLNRNRITRHQPALPLYTMEDAKRALDKVVPIDFNSSQILFENAEFEFLYAGHILGAAMVHLRIAGKKILFSGDLGRMQDPLLNPPVDAPACDLLIVESTYGNKIHPSSDPLDDLERVIMKTYRRGGVVLIPAFSVGRAQQLAHSLSILKKNGRLPEMPIYLNSPMAAKAGDVLCEFRNLHKLSVGECDELKRIAKVVGSAEESKALNEKTGPMIIISASGMLSGGRVVHHLKVFAPDPKNLILLTGFQAAGTRGQAIRDGASEVKVHGEYVPIRAEVVSLDSYSAHADASEILQWLRRSTELKPRSVFVTHGEPAAADELRRRISEQFHWNCSVAEPLQTVVL